MSFGLPYDNLPAPNDKFPLPNDHREMIGDLEFYEEPPVLRFFADKLKAKGDWVAPLAKAFEKEFGPDCRYALSKSRAPTDPVPGRAPPFDSTQRRKRAVIGE
jgi:hypothetical protein